MTNNNPCGLDNRNPNEKALIFVLFIRGEDDCKKSTGSTNHEQ